MATVTIPKELQKNKDLIAVPRNVYEEFLAWQRKLKSTRTFKPTIQQKKALVKARKDYARGNFITLETLEHELGINRP